MSAVVLRTPNRASEAKVKALVKTDLAPLILRVRRDRKLVTSTWLRYWNLWYARHDRAAYKGNLTAYLAIGRRVIETWVTKLKADAFPPSGKWFQVTADTIESEDKVAVVSSLMKQYIKQMGMRRHFTPLARTLLVTGNAPVDIGWKTKIQEVPALQETLNAAGTGTKFEETMVRVIQYLGPTFRPIDPCRAYAYPTTVNDILDLSLLFEDALLDPRDLERLSKKLIHPQDEDLGYHVENWSEARAMLSEGSGSDKDEKFDAERRRQQARGLQSPIDTPGDPNAPLSSTKGFWHVALPGDDGMRWYSVLLAGDDLPLQVREVPFWEGIPTILWPKFVEVQEEFYGYGLPPVMDSLQYFTNDILNQGGDALTFSINPIVGVDPNAVQDYSSIRMKPAARWLVRNPQQNIAFMEPPKDSAMAAMNAVSNMIALMNDVGNVSPYGGGTGNTKSRSRGRAMDTLGGMQLVASEAMVQVQDVDQTLEDLFWNPLLRKMLNYSQQCLDDELLLKVEGARGAALIQTAVTREDLVGQFTLEWNSTTANYNLQVRSAQLNGFLQTIGRIPPQLLQQDNVEIGIGELIRMIWSEGLQMPDVGRIVREAHPVRSIDPGIENQLFLQGRGIEVQVSPADNHLKHLQTHMLLLQGGGLDEPTQAMAEAHVHQHQLAMVVTQVMQQAKAQGMMPGGGGGGLGAPGGMMPGGPGNASGSGALAMPQAPGRTPATADAGDLLRGMDRTPMGSNGGAVG